MSLTKEQIEFRQKGIGGSDAGAIVGVNPYKSALAVYMEKTGMIESSIEETPAMHWGNRLEALVADEYAETSGAKLQMAGQMVHSNIDFLRGLPDFIGKRNGDVFGVEVKTSGYYSKHLWGESGTDQIPDSYIMQVQHYMGIDNLAFYDVPVLIAGQDFRVFRIHNNSDLIKRLQEIEINFWENHVLAGNPPAPDDSKASREYLKKLYPQDTGEIIESEVPSNIIMDITGLAVVKKEIAAKETLELQYTNNIQAYMADRSAIIGGGYKISWKKDKDGLATDYKAIVAELNPDKTIIDKYSKTKNGSRRFLTTGELFKGGNE
jgi:putative phage-type endonuclease